MIGFSVFRGKKDSAPASGEASWETIVNQFRKPRAATCLPGTCAREKCVQKNGLSWSPATWPEGSKRKKKEVDAVHLLVIDLDHLTDEQLVDAIGKFAPYRHIVHASHSDRPGDRCLRVIVALTRPVLGSEWPRFWRAAITTLAVPADPAPKDAGRLYFMPSRPTGMTDYDATGAGYHFAEHDGAPLDVDAILASAPPEPEPRPPAPRAEIPVRATPPATTEEAEIAAVETIARAWPATGRHRASMALCGALARAGWDAEKIADFAAAVAELQEPGNGDYDKRLGHAERSVAMVEAGEDVTGWPTVIAIIGEDAVREARKLLGMAQGVGLGAEELETLVGTAPPLEEVAPPTQDDVRATLRALVNGMVRSVDPERVRGGELLQRICRGDPVTDGGDERMSQARSAIELVVKSAPRGAPPAAVAEILVRSLPFVPIDTLVKLVEHFREKFPAEAGTVNEAKPPQSDMELRGYLVMGRDQAKPCGSNIEIILRWAEDLRGRIRFNELTKQIEIAGGTFADEHPNGLDVAIKNWLERHWQLFASTHEVGEQLLHVARKWGSYDPVAEYLQSVTWDGIERLATWLETYCQAEITDDDEDITGFVRAVGAKFLISAVARALSPGAKVDTVLVLEGPQGAKKSTTLDVLGGAWFTDTPLVMGDKDSRMLAGARWICELAELASLVRSDLDSQKAFISARKDNFRPPYGRVIEEFQRRCVFAGTVNPKKDGDVDYLIDETGDRRWWPVRVGYVDIERLRADRDQLWAEAVHRYKAGETWWFERDEQEVANKIAAARHAQNPWSPLIMSWADVQDRIPTGMLGSSASSPARTAWTMAEIAKGALDIEPRDVNRHAKQIATALREAGFEQIRGKSRGGRERCWARVKIEVVDESGGEEDPEPAPPTVPDGQARLPGTLLGCTAAPPR